MPPAHHRFTISESLRLVPEARKLDKLLRRPCAPGYVAAAAECDGGKIS